MQDGIIAETGNSRYLRTVPGIKQLAPTYDAFLELFIKGELPIDWAGKNLDGWSQAGTDLNKENLLKDATAALMDLGPEATPDQMLAALANTAKTAKETAQSASSSASSAASKVSNLIKYSTTDLTPGSSGLATGTIYLVYE